MTERQLFARSAVFGVDIEPMQENQTNRRTKEE